jgi:hypothetical protein
LERKRAQEWLEILKIEKQKHQIKYEKKRRRCREQLEQLKSWEVEVLSNKPTIEEGKWEKFQIQVHPEYQLREIIQETKRRWGSVWEDESLGAVRLWGREGLLDQEEWRTWIDGERFIVIAQPKEGRPDIEGKSRLGQEKAPVNKFFRESEWRREMSRIWQEDHPDWKEQVADGSEGHSPIHPTIVDAVVKGSVHYGQAVLTTLAEGVREDDPPVSALSGNEGWSICPPPGAEVSISCKPISQEQEEDKEEVSGNPVGKKRLKYNQEEEFIHEVTNGSEGQPLSHLTAVDAVVKGSVHYGQAVLTTLAKGVGDDDPSISALPGTRERSFGPIPEAEVGITCDQISSRDAQDDGEVAGSRELIRGRGTKKLDHGGMDGLGLAETVDPEPDGYLTLPGRVREAGVQLLGKGQMYASGAEGEVGDHTRVQECPGERESRRVIERAEVQSIRATEEVEPLLSGENDIADPGKDVGIN